jgi:protein-disulfide isomerase
VRLVFKFYPLQSHAHGELAARAAVAAMKQGKFWQMHHIMFENQERLEQTDIERYAQQIGLDLGKFRSDLGSDEIKERITKDKAQAEQLGLDGTPFIFVNGRYVNLQLLTNPVDDVPEWVKLDIELSGQPLKPAKGKEEKGAQPASTTTLVPSPKK